MEDLFEGLDPTEQATPVAPKVRVREKSKSAKPSKTLSGLDALFSEAVQEGMQSRPRRRRKPLPKSGLDSLIRTTLDSARVEVDYEAKKRVTFLFEKDKLEKLKGIARNEGSQLKEVISRIVSDYLEQLED